MNGTQSLPFWSISKGQDELQKYKSKVEVFENSVNNWSGRVAKRECSAVIWFAWITDKVHNDAGGQPESS